MTALALIGLAISHALFYLVGKSITENRVLDKHYPEYRRLKEKEKTFEDYLEEVALEDQERGLTNYPIPKE